MEVMGSLGESTKHVQDILRDDVRRQALLNKRGDDAQYWLDFFQKVADSPAVPTRLRSTIYKMTIKLSKNSGRYPGCLFIQNVRQLGEHPIIGGGFGDIWKGSIDNQDTVCLKVAKAYLCSDTKSLAQEYFREAIVWKQLKHPNILPFLGICFLGAGKRVCLVSPWMDHGNLVQYLKANPRESVDHLCLVQDIASGLAYLHAMKVVHGDLKGFNILITLSLRACIGDFGLSRIADTHALSVSSSASQMNGTTRWLAPELLTDRNAVARKTSDIYAFGCVCYEVFTGLVPFHEIRFDITVALAVLAGKRPSRPEALPGLSDAIWSTMERCWNAEPSARPSASNIMQNVAAMRPSAGRRSHSTQPGCSRAIPRNSSDTVRAGSRKRIPDRKRFIKMQARQIASVLF